MKINLNPEIEIETKKHSNLSPTFSVNMRKLWSLFQWLPWQFIKYWKEVFHCRCYKVSQWRTGTKKQKKKEYTVTAKILAFYFLLTLFKSFFVAYFSFKLQFNFSWIYKKQEALRIGKTLIFLKFTLSNTIFVGNDG